MSVDRRRFLTVVSGGLVAAALPGCAAVAVTSAPVEDGTLRLSLADHPELTRAGGSLRVRPEASSELVYVLTLEDGSHAALSPICTHQGCTVQVAAGYLECPCHGSVYTREGSVLQGPAEAPLHSYPVRVSEGTVLISGLQGPA